MAKDFSQFSPSSTIPLSAYIVGYEANESGGERKWTYGTLRSALSSQITSANYLVPVGSVMAFPATSNPTGWLKLNGAPLDRTDYPALWAYAQASGNIVTEAVWTATNTGSFSTGNLSTTFRIPDLRGEFVRGWDNSRGVDSGRGIGVYQSDDFKSHQHITDVLYDRCNATAPGNAVYGDEAWYPPYTLSLPSNYVGGTETRPRNISLLYCIKF
jgi:phage-related tail fiber protein